MTNYEEKLALLMDMIAFSVVDGQLDPREYQFLSLISAELGVDKETLDEMFHREPESPVIPSEHQRIHQFYRLALLMHIDGKLHIKEQEAIHNIALQMGLSPNATNRILNLMEETEYKVLDPNVVFGIFKQQQN
ncbi:tellurite resistance TerB family protein [Flavobacterium silvaticum]|uniref:Excinuclease ABC subunit B n=1 Tax=Flavobacterium silvaticum TaxID=1852020 RepID=A0A972FRA2_9FLAO|nr:excinuclease ABC subunit B [Flavobacterium silvaticum]NMH27919.1 excinuclease ABC subunit B [Flavobacterium silvaticum]